MLLPVLENGQRLCISKCLLLLEYSIRSILEYCCVVWNQNCKVHSNRIESIQRQFFVLFALRKLGWRSLYLYGGIFHLAKHRTHYGNFEPGNNMCRIFNSYQHLYSNFNLATSWGGVSFWRVDLVVHLSAAFVICYFFAMLKTGLYLYLYFFFSFCYSYIFNF